MKLTDMPAKFSIPFASSAGAGYIRNIPVSPSGTAGQASLSVGFPPENFTPVAGGGVPPFGQDFNGILSQATGWNRWQATGMFPPFDSAWQTAVGGYPRGSMVQSLVIFGLVWLSLVDDNITNPDFGGTGWAAWNKMPLTANTVVYVNGSTGSDTLYDGSSATISGSNGPFKTISRAMGYASTFEIGAFTITIQIAAGTYNENVITPQYAIPSIIINGAGATTTVVDGGTTGQAFVAIGPNTMTVSNIKGQNNTANSTPIFMATQSGLLKTNNTASGSSQGAVFQALGPGTVIPGSHSFSGNSAGLFSANYGGSISLPQFAGYVIANNLTVSIATAFVDSNGSIGVPATSAPSWSQPGTVTGKIYNCTTGGGIIAGGNGVYYFPGTVAGTADATTYGWYNP